MFIWSLSLQDMQSEFVDGTIRCSSAPMPALNLKFKNISGEFRVDFSNWGRTIQIDCSAFEMFLSRFSFIVQILKQLLLESIASLQRALWQQITRICLSHMSVLNHQFASHKCSLWPNFTNKSNDDSALWVQALAQWWPRNLNFRAKGKHTRS